MSALTIINSIEPFNSLDCLIKRHIGECMRKPTYSDAQIIEAGKRLLAEQKPVSPFAIRTLLGGGNHVRIRQVWSSAEQMGVDVALKAALDESKPVPSSSQTPSNTRYLASLKPPELTQHSVQSSAPTPSSLGHAAMLVQQQHLEVCLALLSETLTSLQKSHAQLIETLPEEYFYPELEPGSKILGK